MWIFKDLFAEITVNRIESNIFVDEYFSEYGLNRIGISFFLILHANTVFEFTERNTYF